jgi:hypothetical protein
VPLWGTHEIIKIPVGGGPILVKVLPKSCRVKITIVKGYSICCLFALCNLSFLNVRRGDITHACIRMCVRARARDHGNRDAMRCPRARGAGGRMPISYLALYDRPVVWLPHSLEHHMGRSACHSPHRDHIRVAMGVTASHALEKRLDWLARLQGSYTIKNQKARVGAQARPRAAVGGGSSIDVNILS